MLAIDRMRADLRLSGDMPAREHLARRLERLARTRVGAALENVAEGFAEDGEHIVIRRLDLRLWLDAAHLDDGRIAQLWAAALARALYRQLATGGPDRVRRYPDRAAFLLHYLTDVAAGRADGAWQYQEFARLQSLPEGRRAVAALAGDPRWIGPVLHRLAAVGRLEAVIARWTGPDIARLWQVWTEQPPRASAHLPLRALARAAGLVPPVPETGDGPDARARLALRWLVALTARPLGLPAMAAAPLAIQLVHAAALTRAMPDLPALLAGGRDHPALAALLASAPAAAATDWLRRVLDDPGNAPGLARLLEIATGTPVGQGTAPQPQSRSIASPYAGLALLLPVLRDLGLGARLGPAGRLMLLTATIPFPQRLLAQGDRLLRLLTGLPQEAVLADLAPAIDWPAPIDPAESPEAAALHVTLTRFAQGLRGMEAASPAYLTRQFLSGGGVLIEAPGVLRLRLDPVPLAILLRVGGRLGPQGAIPWRAGRELLLEMPDG